MHGTVTPTQRASIKRSKNFRAAIAAKAAELAQRKATAALSALRIAALEAPLVSPPEIKIAVSDLIPEPTDKWTITAPHDPRPTQPSVREIQQAVCDHYDVQMLDMMSRRRTADIIKPRQVAMYLAKTLTLRSLPDIGRRFGGRDHTTALHAVRKIEGLLPLDQELAHEVAILTHTITGVQQ